VAVRPGNVSKEVIDSGQTVSMMRSRRNKGGFTNIGDAIDLQIAERKARLTKLATFSLVENANG
jgi:hypothetical protein